MRSSGCCGGEVMTMEVPLAWQDPVPLTCFSGMEGESEDVPPSPTPDPITPTLAAGTFFQRGFLDCAQEALRFLTEEEGMLEDNPVVVGLRQHLVYTTPYLTRTTSSRSVSTRPSEQGRFSPYTVPSYRSLALGCTRRGADKHVTSLLSERGSMQHRRSASSGVPSTRRMEHVLTDELISSDDLQGVLRCLGSGQSLSDPPQHQHSLEPHLSLTPSPLTLYQPPVCVEAGVNGEEKRVNLQNSSLDDSGVSEASCADLADEVDGMDSLCFTTTGSVCDTYTASATNMHSVSVSVLDSAEVGGDAVGSRDSVYSQRCVAADKLTHEILPTNSELSAPSHSHFVSLASTVPASVSVSGSSTSTASAVSSSPSSQLELLSSLSSGTHRLTSSPMAMGTATASRIQSLASQILLLLQEEVDSQDYSDEESDDDDDDDHVSLGDSDVEDDLLDVEAEP